MKPDHGQGHRVIKCY